jgi:hypothetical protein
MRITVPSQPGLGTRAISKKYSQKRALGVAQDVGPDFKLQYRKKKSGKAYIVAFEKRSAKHQWLTSVIPATQRAEIRSIMVLSRPG